jgi:hypothetical protein
MRVNPKIVQLIGDAVIPVLGYFIWDWSLYFIVVFYLLDYITNEFFIHLKSKKISEYKGSGRNVQLGKGIISASLLTTVIVLTHAMMFRIHPDLDLKQELISFWTYKDMGIEQGYVLLPLIILVGYQRYKLEFIVPGMFKKQTVEALWGSHVFAHYILLGVIGSMLGLSVFVIMPETVYLAGIILLTSLYQLFFKNN